MRGFVSVLVFAGIWYHCKSRFRPRPTNSSRKDWAGANMLKLLTHNIHKCNRAWRTMLRWWRGVIWEPSTYIYIYIYIYRSLPIYRGSGKKDCRWHLQCKLWKSLGSKSKLVGGQLSIIVMVALCIESTWHCWSSVSISCWGCVRRPGPGNYLKCTWF